MPGERKRIYDDCGTIFSGEDECIHADFGLCNLCIESDWRKSMNIPTGLKEEGCQNYCNMM